MLDESCRSLRRICTFERTCRITRNIRQCCGLWSCPQSGRVDSGPLLCSEFLPGCLSQSRQKDGKNADLTYFQRRPRLKKFNLRNSNSLIRQTTVSRACFVCSTGRVLSLLAHLGCTPTDLFSIPVWSPSRSQDQYYHQHDPDFRLFVLCSCVPSSISAVYAWIYETAKIIYMKEVQILTADFDLMQEMLLLNKSRHSLRRSWKVQFNPMLHDCMTS